MTVALAYLQSLVPALGWTLAHFLWQGALVAFALQVALKACRTARARHDWALAALAVMAIAPVATFAWLQAGVRIALVPRGFPGLTPAGQQWETFAVAAWLAGVAALAVRMVGGLVLVERLRRTAVALSPDWADRCRRLEQQIATPLRVLFAQSEAVATPIVAGWLKPMVLIPAGFLTRLPPAELEALILHELAHVRRLDAFANLIQSVVETVLFYHPAVWWVSRRVRLEREQCCDDLAVAAVRDPALYVRALQSIEALRVAPYGVLAADGGDLKRRAARILGMATTPERPALSRFSAVAILALGAIAMTHSAAVQAKPETTSLPALATTAAAPTTSESAPALTPVSPERAPTIVLAEAAGSPEPTATSAAPNPVQPPASASATPLNTVSGVTVPAPAQAGPIAATVDMAGDEDSARGNYVVIWPATAYHTAANGHVTLSCLIDAHGVAERCRVASETPANKGFGKAALELRPTFKLTPAKGPDGQPISASMSISIGFKPPDFQFDGEAFYRELAQVAKGPLGGFGTTNAIPRSNPLTMREVTMLDAPVWAQAANFDDLARAYPAKGGGAEGYAVAHCQVQRSGALDGCQIIKEEPEGRDFGKAAVDLAAAKFRVAPQLAATHHSSPLWVDVPIRLPPPAQLADRTVMAPQWITGMDPTATPRIFPPEAVASGLTTGRGVARCTVASDGSMAGCAPEAGEPDGLGFSEAAAKLASTMKMNLWSADGAPVEGGVVHVPIRLNLKGGG